MGGSITLNASSIQMINDHDGLQQDDPLPSISIRYLEWWGGSESLKLHTRSSSTFPVTMNKENSVLRISFRWKGDKDSRIVIKVVKESEVLFEIEDWTQPSNDWSKNLDRYYYYSHDYVKNLKEGCHFELHYAVGGRGGLDIKDFELCVEDIKSTCRSIENSYQSMRRCSIPEVELRGISIKQLKAVYAEIEARCVVEGWTDKDGQLLTPQQCNLYDIKDRIIMKRTESKQCSYVELIATGPQKPTRFVSHWWGEPVIAMIRCLDQFSEDHNLSEETTYYWICAYANNQHKIAEEMLTNPFLKAMSICEGTVSILDAGCVVYSRIWCIFELFKSVMSGNSNYEFDVYTEIDRDKGAVGITHGYISNDNGSSVMKKERESKFPLDRILQATNIDIKLAQASVESDRNFIFNTITGLTVDDAVLDNHTKYDELNNILRGIFVAPVLERIIQEKDIENITRCLDIVEVSNARIINVDLQYRTRFDDDMVMKLADSLPPTLTQFTLKSRGSAVTVNGINACLGKILGYPQLVRLNLCHNDIGADGAKHIADALKDNHSLKELNLSFNNIGDDGAKQIADALKVNRSLKELWLMDNKIGDDGAKMIADALKVHYSLEELELCWNNISADGKEYLSKSKQELKDANRDININW